MSARERRTTRPGADAPAKRAPLEILLEHAGVQRRALIHPPLEIDAGRPLPVVCMLHGGGGSPEFAIEATRLPEKADEAGFIAVFPESTRPDSSRPLHFLKNAAFWDTGSGRGFLSKRNVDDVGFIAALLDLVESRWPVDRDRIFAAGFSNGGSMAMRLGIELSHRIAAVASVAGRLWTKDRAPPRPVSLIYVTGDADPLNPLAGGAIRSPWGRQHDFEPVWDFLRVWAEWLGHRGEPQTVRTEPGLTVTRCSAPYGTAEMLLYVVHGMGHVWPGGRNVLNERWTGPMSDRILASDEIWAFFTRHAMASA